MTVKPFTIDLEAQTVTAVDVEGFHLSYEELFVLVWETVRAELRLRGLSDPSNMTRLATGSLELTWYAITVPCQWGEETLSICGSSEAELMKACSQVPERLVQAFDDFLKEA